jgi:hypothetical protein
VNCLINFKNIGKLFVISLLLAIFIGCGGSSFAPVKDSVDSIDSNVTDAEAPSIPTLKNPENNNATTYADTISIILHGEINATIWVDGNSTGKDINSTGEANITFDLNNSYGLYDFNITLKDKSSNESSSLLFMVTKLKMPPSAPTLISPENNMTTFADKITLIISGEINASVFVNDINTSIDINSTGKASIPIDLNNGYILHDFNITLKDREGLESSPLEFLITKIKDPDAGRKIKAMEISYVKDANIKSFGNSLAADYNDTTNTYIFNTSPGYNITLQNGEVKELNMSLDINMSTKAGNVISPVTTIIAINENTKNKLATILGIGSSIENFSKDYIGLNDLELSKISAISYLAIKSPSLTDYFISTLTSTNSINTISALGNNLSIFIENNTSLTIFEKYFNKKFIGEVASFDGAVDTMATLLKATRYAMDGNYTFLPINTILKTNQTVCFDKANPTTQIGCQESNASGDGNGTYGVVRSFVKSDAVVTDNSSKLQWHDDDQAILKNWDNAKIYCDNLSVSGIQDWSLPTIDELNSIVDRNSTDLTNITDSAFAQRSSIDFWSETLYKGPISDSYWIIYFSNGLMTYGGKTGEHFVRCVHRIK